MADLITIQGLHARVAEGPEILKGLDLVVQPGEIHAIMGPNGAGKSTLSRVLAGHPSYQQTAGIVSFQGKDLFSLEAPARANEGLFMGFQYPVEVGGVNNAEFLRLALNSKRKHLGLDKIADDEFTSKLAEAMAALDMDDLYRTRGVNQGFSGGQKKRNEILQLLFLEPTLAILDETDSGLDIDALRVVAAGVNRFMATGNGTRGTILVTHYQRLLDLIQPTFVHVLRGGRIVLSGGPELALELEKRGYDWIP